ncbi:MAG: hypothetical protein LBV69_08255 [Bacteroidales bacterium]|jgi:hypothetical protein|nr:hypothetical protein [Bacteroidales bacterium]
MRIKTLVFTVAFLLISFSLFAEAQELKSVMPNSWQNIVKLTKDEEQKFLLSNKSIIDMRIMDLQKNKNIFNSDHSLNQIINIQIYQEIVGNEIFYRVIFSNSEDIDYASRDCKFEQMLVYKNIKIATGAYNINKQMEFNELDSYELCVIYESIDVLESNNIVSGILITTVSTSIDDSGKFTAKRKEQSYGKNMAYFHSLKNNTIDSSTKIVYCNISFSPDAMIPDGNIMIRASDCLLDNNVPLKYSLQNAFDNNPSTSYVENAENDFMYIDFFTREEKALFSTTAFAIINGYAQNNSLYYSNNRVKEIAYNTKFYQLSGVEKWWKNVRNTMMDLSLNEFSVISLPEKLTYTIQTIEPGIPFTYQAGQNEYYDASRLFLLVADIYKGNKYNDTCIAEINIKTENGWLFGDIGE